MNQQRQYGDVTALAKQYGVSRWFIYFCQSMVNALLAIQLQTYRPTSCQPTVEQCVVSLYLNCPSSLDGISKTLKELFGLSISQSTVGHMLQKIGKQLPSHEQGLTVTIKVLSDELFLNGNPVLITLEPQSLYILSIELTTQRDGDSWGYVWLEITDNDTTYIQSICSDKGTGLTSAIQNLLTESLYCYDLFHYLRPIFRCSVHLNNQAKKAFTTIDQLQTSINNKQTALKVLTNIADESPKHAKQLLKLQNKLTELEQQLVLAQTQLDKCLLQLDDFDNLTKALQECFSFIDQSGKLKTAQQAKETLAFIIDYLLLIEHSQIQKAAKYLLKHAEDALAYYQTIKQIAQQMPTYISDPFIQQVCLFIWDLKRQLKTAKASKKRYLKKQIADWQQSLEEDLGKTKAKQYLNWLAEQMSQVVRSSSLIENLNGRIRIFAHAARGQLSQSRLNLIRFYLNHKPFNRSRCDERKGYSPYQLFHHKKDDTRTWWEILKHDYLDHAA